MTALDHRAYTSGSGREQIKGKPILFPVIPYRDTLHIPVPPGREFEGEIRVSSVALGEGIGVTVFSIPVTLHIPNPLGRENIEGNCGVSSFGSNSHRGTTTILPIPAGREKTKGNLSSLPLSSNSNKEVQGDYEGDLLSTTTVQLAYDLPLGTPILGKEHGVPLGYVLTLGTLGDHIIGRGHTHTPYSVLRTPTRVWCVLTLGYGVYRVLTLGYGVYRVLLVIYMYWGKIGEHETYD